MKASRNVHHFPSDGHSLIGFGGPCRRGLCATWLLAVMAGCPQVPSGPPRSETTEPTVSFDYGDDVKWVALEGFVDKGPPALPVPLRRVGLDLGQPSDVAVTALISLQDPRLDTPKGQKVGDRIAVGVVLAEVPDVGATIILGPDRTVTEIDVSLPTDQALYLFTEAWGEPRMTSHDKLGPVAVWDHPTEALRVEVSHTPGRKSIAKFQRP